MTYCRAVALLWSSIGCRLLFRNRGVRYWINTNGEKIVKPLNFPRWLRKRADSLTFSLQEYFHRYCRRDDVAQLNWTPYTNYLHNLFALRCVNGNNDPLHRVSAPSKQYLYWLYLLVVSRWRCKNGKLRGSAANNNETTIEYLISWSYYLLLEWK